MEIEKASTQYATYALKIQVTDRATLRIGHGIQGPVVFENVAYSMVISAYHTLPFE